MTTIPPTSSRVRPGRHPDDRAIAALAVPALGALAADPLYSLVDTAYVGHLGVAQLGGLAVGVAAFTASFWVFSFLAYGVTPQIARSLGAGQPEEAARVGVQAILLALLLGSGVTLVGLTLAGPVVRMFGASDDVVRFAEPYLRIRSLAAVPVLLAQVGQGYLRGAHDTKTPTYIVVAGALSNVVVGYLFIFVAGWGMEGAAGAVVVCQTGAALAFLVVLRRRMTQVPWRPDWSVMRSLLKVGGQLALRTGSLLAGLTLATSMAARIGTVTLASWQIAMQVFLLMALILDSVAIAAQTLVATHLGAGEPARARTVASRLLAVGTSIGLVLGIGLVLVAAPTAGLFTRSSAVAATATSLLIWMGLLQPLGALAFTLDGILIGASDLAFLAVAMVGSTVVFVGTMFWLDAAGAGLWALIIGMSVWIALRGASTFWRLTGSSWLEPAEV